jgi:hypothetical protein
MGNSKLITKFWLFQILGTMIFMIGVFACYQGALVQMPWVGLLVVGVILVIDLLINRKQVASKLKLVALVGLAGFLIETLMIAIHVYSVSPTSKWLLSPPWVPVWILALWLNFGIRVPAYLPFFRGKHLINILVGFVFAFFIFNSASNLHLINLNFSFWSIIICGIAWAILVPLIYIVANQLFPLKNQ